MPRRAGGSSELRDLLAAHHAYERERWDAAAVVNWERRRPETRGPRPEPRGVSDFERALRAGADVPVSSGQLFRALQWAGRTSDAVRFSWRGHDFKSRFVVRGTRLEPA